MEEDSPLTRRKTQDKNRGAAQSGPGSSLQGTAEKQPSARKSRGLPPAKATAAGSAPAVAPAGGVRAPGAPARDAFSRWSAYYAKHDESPRELLNLLLEWRQVQKGGRSEMANAEVEGIIKAYLTKNGRHAQSWMYEQLAVAIELNKGPSSEVKESLDWAVELARREGDPNALLSVADLLMMRKFYDVAGPAQHPVKVADLIKKSAEKLQHRGEPLLMAMLLAERRLDPELMTWSIDRLLALGWPGIDDTVRTKTGEQVEALAAELRKKDRAKEADALIDAYKRALPRDIAARLTWKGYGDLDLIVHEPLGATASYATPRTVFGGALVKNGFGKSAEEVYVCPRGFDGEYVINLDKVADDPKDPIKEAKLEIILHEGGANEQRIVKEIDPMNLKPITFKLAEGRRKTVLPFVGQPSVEEMVKWTAPKPKVARNTGAKDGRELERTQSSGSGRPKSDRVKP